MLLQGLGFVGGASCPLLPLWVFLRYPGGVFSGPSQAIMRVHLLRPGGLLPMLAKFLLLRPVPPGCHPFSVVSSDAMAQFLCRLLWAVFRNNAI